MSRTAPFTAPVLRFDNFELDGCAGEWRKRGVKLRLQGQPGQVLAILLQSPGNLVTREELRNQLWPAEAIAPAIPAAPQGQAVQERSMDLAWFLPADPRMDTLHSDPRFQVLLRQVGFPQ